MPDITGSTATIVREQVKRIHCAVNDGTLDRDTVNDALAKLSALLDGKDASKPDSFTSFTGQEQQPKVAGVAGPSSPDLNTQPPPFTPPQDG